MNTPYNTPYPDDRRISNEAGDPRIGPPGIGILTGNTGVYGDSSRAYDNDNPGLPTTIYLSQAAQWPEIELCLGGNALVRRSASMLIPRLQKEKRECYSRRLQHVLYSPFLQRVINAAIGLILRKPIELKGGNETWWAEWRENVDRQGTSLDDFCRPLLLHAIAYGHCGCLADAGPQEAETLEDQRLSGERPFLQLVRPQQIIGWRETVSATGSVLDQVRIRETTTEPRGRFGVATIQQIRVLEPKTYEVYRMLETVNERWMNDLYSYNQNYDSGVGWYRVEESSGTNELGRIPLSVVYCGRDGVLLSTPQLRDVAFVNLQHTRLQSKLLHALDVAGFPILTLMGWDDTSETIDADVTSALALPIGGGASYTEPASSSFTATQEQLTHLEEQMRTLGVATLAQQKLVAETEGSKLLDRADTNSLLATVSLSLEQAIQEQIDIVAELAGVEAAEVGLDRNYDHQSVPYGVTEIVALYNAGIIDRELALVFLERGEMLSEGVDDIDEILGRLDLQDAEALEQQQEMMAQGQPGETSGGSSMATSTSPTP